MYEDESALPIEQGKIQEILEAAWSAFDAHIFIGAAGIAVRSIAPCLTRKSLDPAVISCTDTGNYCISLVSGHIGGANRLARKIARITGGQACISTATDTHNLTGIDEIAMLEQARILNPKAIIFLINIFKIHLSVIVRKILKIYLVFIGIKPRKIHIQRQNFI